MRLRLTAFGFFALTFLTVNPIELSAIFASSPESPLLKISLFGLFNPQELHIRSTKTVIILEALSGGQQHKTNNARLRVTPTGISALLSPTSSKAQPENLDYPGGVRITSSTGLSLSPDPQKLPFRNYRGAVRVTRQTNGALLILEEVRLEDYVTGVTAAEMKESKKPEARKALSVAARTFALKNKSRHEKDGYDLCDTTHCQLYQGWPFPQDGTLAAVWATEGEVLYRGTELAWIYYNSTCGGKTADQSDFPGDPQAQGYKSVSDEDYCRASPHANWEYSTNLEGIQKALAKEGLWPEGDTLKDVSIARRGTSGRTVRMRLQGNQVREIDAWDFRNAMCRTYGWSTVKSTLFEIQRKNRNLTFRGRGLGHGLGLCQHGAIEMARRGFNYREILRHYYPEFEIRGNTVGARHAVPLHNIAEAAGGVTPPLEAQSEHFILHYSSPAEENQILPLLEKAYKTLKERYGYHSQGLVKVTFYASTENYCRATGQPWWLGATTTSEGMYFQPVGVLQKRGGLATYILHEYTHWMVQEVSKGRSPLWLGEGLALLESGEGVALEEEFSHVGATGRSPLQEIEENLHTAKDKETLRQNYYWAYKFTRCLEARYGRGKIFKFIGLLGQGTKEADAGKQVFGEGWEKLKNGICN